MFLDACRDNPALFKNIVVGRGSGPIGLAPATVSNFNQKPGGGVFIAYATDAGAVADDGHGQHSPFTQALLRYMQNPISIDDMFSLVTREVRLVSKNAQRPYKYASLENIVCLTPVCSGTPIVNSGDVVQQAKQSEEEDLQSALRTNNVAALDTFLRKYPDTSKSTDILNAVASLKRAEMTEWTLFEIGDKHNPQYMQLSSIQRFGDRAAVRMKSLVDETKPKVFFNRPFPDAAYSEDLNVYDCTAPRMVVAEDSIFNKSGQLLYHYKFGDPQYVNFAIGVPLSPGSVGSSASYVVCHDAIGTPSVGKEQLAAMKFHSLQTLADGGGELFSELVQRPHYEKDQREALLIGRYFADRSIMNLLAPDFSIPDPPNYRFEIDDVLFKCNEKKYALDKIEFWSASNQLVRIAVPNNVIFSDIPEFSSYALQHQMYCGDQPYAGLGIRIVSENNKFKIAEVFSGSPAEKAGLKTDDVIAGVDGTAVDGLTMAQIISKTRGKPGTTALLSILRGIQTTPLEISVTRETVKAPTAQLGDPK